MAGIVSTGSGVHWRIPKQGLQAQLNKVYGWYTGGFIAFVLVLGGARADGPAQDLDRHDLPVGHGRACMPASAS